MKKSIAVIVASFTVSVFAAETIHNWFDMDIKDIGTEGRMWPTDGSDYFATFCVVTNTSVGTYADHRISIQGETPMTVIAEAPAAISAETYVSLKTKMMMEPFSGAEVPEVPAGAKSAVIAVVSDDTTNFWVAAGINELHWTNTCIAADLTKEVTIVMTASNGIDCVCTDWDINGQIFSCQIQRVNKLQGVSLSGNGSVSECGGDVYEVGLCCFFEVLGIPSELRVVVTNEFGREIVRAKGKSERVGYTCAKDARLGLSFFTPDGWAYYDGTTEWTDQYTNSTSDAKFTPMFGYGISDSDFGPINGWLVLSSEIDPPLLIGRYTSAQTADALAAMKNGYGLVQCYPEEHVVEYGPDGSSVTIDGGVSVDAKPHYHYLDAEGVPMLAINEEEYAVTSFGECSTNASLMVVGSVNPSVAGFDYSVIYGSDVSLTNDVSETESVPGNGGKLDLVAPKGDEGKRFYRINITD